MRMMKNQLLFRVVVSPCLVAMILAAQVSAQDAVPVEILQRTLLIHVGDDEHGYGTAFAVDHDGKIYLVTARHMVASLPLPPDKKALIHVWHDNKWVDLKPVKILFPTSVEVDIAVLETEQKVSKAYEIQPSSGTEAATFGQQIWFLGYPTTLGGPALFKLPFAFIKRGILSGIDHSPDATLYYMDGFNNPGFSGGPILYWDFSSHAYRILGVVCAYKPEVANGKSVVNGQVMDTQVLVNAGIFIGYSIRHAMQAIESDAKKP
jgi:hypothetical protein